MSNPSEWSKDQVMATYQQCVQTTYGRTPLVFVRGEGVNLWDADGKRYLDWVSGGRAGNALGHCHPHVTEALKRQAETLNAVLYRATETLRWLAVLTAPVMPDASKKIYAQLGLGEGVSKIDPADLKWGDLPSETRIGESVGIFPRIDKGKVMSEIKEESTGEQPGSEPPSRAGATEPAEAGTQNEDDFITIDDFLKVELRVGEIKVAERIPKADKLLRFEIDLGEEKPRQILAGLAEYYEPEKLIGRKVVVVANLKPRKMRGLESQGMICAASLGDGDIPAIATFVEDVAIGARLK